MLMGEHKCNMDEKGRLNFPAKFRDDMGEEFVVTRWLDKCLVAFPQTEWERIDEILASKSLAKSRNIMRFIYSGASMVSPDKQGRILVAPPQRQHAGLEKEVVVIGMKRYAEIWDADAWQQLTSGLDDEMIAAQMEELEI